MSDTQEDLARIELAAEQLIPELGERLTRHGLGEIEVRAGGLRVRVAGPPATAAPAVVAPARSAAAHPGAARSGPLAPSAEGASSESGSAPVPIASPAVGYFVFGEGLGPGMDVQKGDSLGFVDVLGVRHEVRAPQAGTVRNLVTETSEAVEYGQTLLELEAARA
jgi:biotin carboxyl carrier protein